MARKRKRGRKLKKQRRDLSDGVKQSILAVVLVAAAIIFLLSFFDLAGTVGIVIDGFLSSIFGWDRWLFAVLLFVFGWNSIFPDRRVFTGLNIAGMILFFLSLNGLMNLILVEDAANTEELLTAGGYIGLLVSEFLVSL
ncbi:DNA translocase FtsK 4TM domain-containing protein, partial [Patescibacteria group bacterium]|nr:DNA translocase FtsK 4TM domain-containing protein [Patescibacteria group bacterium]